MPLKKGYSQKHRREHQDRKKGWTHAQAGDRHRPLTTWARRAAEKAGSPKAPKRRKK